MMSPDAASMPLTTTLPSRVIGWPGAAVMVMPLSSSISMNCVGAAPTEA